MNPTLIVIPLRPTIVMVKRLHSVLNRKKKRNLQLQVEERMIYSL